MHTIWIRSFSNASLIYPMQGPPAESEVADQPHSNRFNAVIEKIERLYMVCFPIFPIGYLYRFDECFISYSEHFSYHALALFLPQISE